MALETHLFLRGRIFYVRLVRPNCFGCDVNAVTGLARNMEVPRRVSMEGT